MPIVTRWLIDKRVLISFMIGEITEADTHQMADNIATLLAEGTPPVHTITVLDTLEKPFVNLTSLKSTLEIFKDPRIGWSVAYGKANPVVKFITSSIMQVLGFKSRQFSTRDEAFEFLIGIEPELKEQLETVGIEETQP